MWTPNQTKSYPWATTIGAKSGTKIKMIAIESITHPKTKKTKRMQQINEMPSNPVDCTIAKTPIAKPDMVKSFDNISAPKRTV